MKFFSKGLRPVVCHLYLYIYFSTSNLKRSLQCILRQRFQLTGRNEKHTRHCPKHEFIGFKNIKSAVIYSVIISVIIIYFDLK